MNLQDTTYKQWLTELKSKIRSTQAKAAIAVNTALIQFYWELGKMIAEKENVWGSKLIEQLAKDLKEAFPDVKGLTRSNLFYCKQFYLFYQNEFIQQVVGQLQSTNNHNRAPILQLVIQIPWGHNIQIFTKSKNIEEATFYIQQTLENNWSRDTLALQIKTDLYGRKGKAVTNFKHTLPSPQSDLAQQTLKDPLCV